MPGTPSGVNHSSDSQKCGRKTMPRSASSASRSPMRFCSTLPSIERSSSDIRRSRSLSSLHLAQSGVLRRGRDGVSGGAAAGAALRPARAGRVAPGRPRSPFQNGLKPQKCQRADAATVPECAGKGETADEGPSPHLGGRDPAVRGGGFGADRAARAAIHHRSVPDDDVDLRCVVLGRRVAHSVLVEQDAGSGTRTRSR